MATTGKGQTPEWPPREEFADRLARLRRHRKDLDNEAIAAAVGCSPNTVSNWRGWQKPEGMVLIRLAKLFGVTPEWLLEGEAQRMVAERPRVEFPKVVDQTKPFVVGKGKKKPKQA